MSTEEGSDSGFGGITVRRLTKESRNGFRAQTSNGSFLRLATQSPSHMTNVVKMNNKAGQVPREDDQSKRKEAMGKTTKK